MQIVPIMYSFGASHVSKYILITFMITLFSFCFPGSPFAMDLDEAVSTALRQSPLLGEKVHERKAAEEALKAVRGEFLPRVDAVVQTRRLSDPSAVVPIKSFGGSPPFFSRDLYSASLDLSFPLYQGGRIRSRAAVAGFEEAASAGRETLAAQTLVADVKTVFLQILALKDLEKAARTSVDAVTTLRNDTQRRFDAGEIAPVDLLRMETRLAQEGQSLVRTREELGRARNVLQVLLGAAEPVDAEGDLAEPGTGGAIGDEDIAGLVEGREDVRIALAEISRAEENVRLERAGSLPSLDLVGEYGRKAGSGLEGDEEVWSAGLSLSQNLFDGGVTRHRVKAAASRLDAAGERLRQARLRAREDIEGSLSRIREQKARLSAARAAEKTAGEAYRLERARYMNGLASAADTLLAQADWARSQAEAITALADLNAAEVAFELASGRIHVPEKGEF